MNLEPTGGMPQEQPQMMPPQEMPMEQPMPEQGGGEGIPHEELIQQAEQVLQQDPQALAEIQQKLEASGMDIVDVELLGGLAVDAMAYPEKYEQIVAAIVAMFPELQEGLSGDVSQDGASLMEFVLAAVASEGGRV